MSQSMSTAMRARRFAAAAVTGVVALSVAPFGTASAQTATRRQPISVDVFCGKVPDGYHPFDDVVDSHTFADEIRCLEYAGITLGVSDRVYAPAGTVSREQMASFLVRMADVAVELDIRGEINPLPAYDGTNDFDDIVEGAEHAEAVNRLAAAGITLGGPGRLPGSSFGPALPVSREQMASFVFRTLVHLSDPGETSPMADHFTDDDTSVHEENIDELAERRISVGDGFDLYQPGALVTRGQMSAYLMRTLAHHEDTHVIAPLFAPAPPVPDAAISTTGSVDNGNGTATLQLMVYDAASGKGLGGLSAADFQLTLPDGTVTDLASLLAGSPGTWSDFTAVSALCCVGGYSVLVTAEPGTYTFTDVTVLDVKIDRSLEVTIAD